MDFLIEALLPVLPILSICGGIAWYCLRIVAPGEKIQKGLMALQNENNGEIIGVPLSKIIEKCGYPSANSALGNGQTLKQWQAPKYHVALIFDENDICQGVSTEISV